MYKNFCKKMTSKELEVIEKGKGKNDKYCKWAWLACLNDTAMSWAGTSDPASTCEYMKKVCN
ncbi:hypothetical protein [Helcococcus kunzii]|uniref:Uncharacterized protein n=1 Tax=Helcococcus kunzii ATCC 51366 TaxID=883114 RepID=H3NM16_9FIRM|nr:hypothetical protein [Helcococcus kunzii]EHR35686.1 hypothetical protein HMPREF9709_00377 [Helcococcus kunzii ATCC 51366]